MSQMKTSKNRKLAVLAYFVGALAVFFLAEYLTAPVIVFPLAGAAVSFWFFYKKAGPALRRFLPAVVLQSGHYLWITVTILLAGLPAGRVIDILVMIFGLRWLIKKPGRRPVVLLSLYNLFLLTSYAVALRQADNLLSFKTLLFHILLSLFSIGYMIYGLVFLNKDKDEVEEESE